MRISQKSSTFAAQKMKSMRNIIVTTVVFILLLTGCNTRQQQYRIGVSQCLDDAWRQKMNEEMDRELLLHPDMSMTQRIAYGSTGLQCAQIDSFIAERVDLLIVSPNEAEAVRPAVSRAYRAGIPVIVADRRIPGEEWTAFIGGDNYEVGRLMASWVNEIQKGSGKPVCVLEVYGKNGSVPEELRHKGLTDGLSGSGRLSPVLNIVSGEQDAYAAVRTYLQTHAPVDVIVAQNDIMAVEAARAVRNSRSYDNGTMRIMGVDGIELGLQAIVDGEIECTAVYPSRGDMLIQTAAHILAGEPFVRDTVLETMLIDKRAAYPMLRQYIARRHDLETLHIVQLQADARWRQMNASRGMWICICVVTGILFFMALGFVLYMVRMMQTEIKKDIIPQLEEVNEVIRLKRRDEVFAERVRQIVDEHLTDADLNVEYLAEVLQLDRTQVFRRVKAVYGKGPMEYIRERRLIRAYELLHTTDKTVRQVAMELRFASPGYFSKYYKEYYGYLPSEH